MNLPSDFYSLPPQQQLDRLTRMTPAQFYTIPSEDLGQLDYYEVVQPATIYHIDNETNKRVNIARTGTAWMVMSLVACGVAVWNLASHNGTGTDLYIWASIAAIIMFATGIYAKFQDPRAPIESVGDAFKHHPYISTAAAVVAADWILDEATDKVADRVIEKTKK